MTQYL